MNGVPGVIAFESQAFLGELSTVWPNAVSRLSLQYQVQTPVTYTPICAWILRELPPYPLPPEQHGIGESVAGSS